MGIYIYNTAFIHVYIPKKEREIYKDSSLVLVTGTDRGLEAEDKPRILRSISFGRSPTLVSFLTPVEKRVVERKRQREKHKTPTQEDREAQNTWLMKYVRRPWGRGGLRR